MPGCREQRKDQQAPVPHEAAHNQQRDGRGDDFGEEQTFEAHVLSTEQGGAPVISWFIIPITIDITPINPSYSTYKPT